METNVVKIIDDQVNRIKEDKDLLPVNKVYKIEALEELRSIVSRVELPVKPEIAEIIELVENKIEEIRELKRNTPEDNCMYRERMMMGTYAILVCKNLIDRIQKQFSV